MTISAAPAASGVKTLWLSTLTTTTKVRKNAPIVSTAYLRISVVHGSAAATATDSCSLAMTSAICFLLEYQVLHSTIARLQVHRHPGQRSVTPLVNRATRIPANCNHAGGPLFVHAEMKCGERLGIQMDFTRRGGCHHGEPPYSYPASRTR